MRRNLRPEDLGDLLELPILAVLATQYADGRTLLSPVWHEWEEGGFSILTWAQDIKSRQLARDPRATVLVAEPTPPFRSLEVHGEAKLASPPDAADRILRMATRYYGPEVGAERAKAFAGIDLELIRVVPGVLRAWDFADEFA